MSLVENINPYDIKLPTTWTLYYYPKLKSGEWGTDIMFKVFDKFEKIDNVGTFWEMMGILSKQNPKNPSIALIHTQDFFLMKDPFKPVWEDEKNNGGGIFSILIEQNKILSSFKDFCIGVVSGYYPAFNNVNGVQSNFKTATSAFIKKGINENNRYICYVKIWCGVEDSRLVFPDDVVKNITEEMKGKLYKSMGKSFDKKDNFYRKKNNKY